MLSCHSVPARRCASRPSSHANSQSCLPQAVTPNYPPALITGRPASLSEGPAYLQHPAFSNCTVPVLLYPFWLTNFGHTLRGEWACVVGTQLSCMAPCMAPFTQRSARRHACMPPCCPNTPPTDNAAKLWGFVQDTGPWAPALKMVPVTADGLGAPAFAYQLLQPLSALRVETWADFSARLVSD